MLQHQEQQQTKISSIFKFCKNKIGNVFFFCILTSSSISFTVTFRVICSLHSTYLRRNWCVHNAKIYCKLPDGYWAKLVRIKFILDLNIYLYSNGKDDGERERKKNVHFRKMSFFFFPFAFILTVEEKKAINYIHWRLCKVINFGRIYVFILNFKFSANFFFSIEIEKGLFSQYIYV